MAVGLDKNGNEVCRTLFKSAGEKVTKLCALPEADSISREDLCYVRLQYTDTNGVWKPLARGDIKVEVEGGELFALGSACPYNEKGYLSDTTDTYFGEALAIIRPARNANAVVVTAHSKYGDAQVSVAVR